MLHIATLNHPIGLQNGYGPIESVIHGLDLGLHRAGYRSVVACSADSRVTGAKLATVTESHGAYCASESAEAEARVRTHLRRSFERAAGADIDVVHMHEWYERVLDGAETSPVPVIVTLHVPAEHSALARYAGRLAGRSQVHFVAISDYQRRQYEPMVPVAATIPHGIDTAEYRFGKTPDASGYLFSIGRISRVKGQDTAIEVARRSGRKLILAGCIQDKPEDRAFFEEIRGAIDLSVDLSGVAVGPRYYETVMRPLLESESKVIYVGELKEEAKKHWYRGAAATLFPIRWGEPFGMVLIESMASGTPVIAFREGAVPEIISDGQSGFIAASVAEMAAMVEWLPSLDRANVRRQAESRFSTGVMAGRYGDLYRRLMRARPVIVPSGIVSVPGRAAVAVP